MAVSISFSLHVSISSIISSGGSVISYFVGSLDSSHTQAFFVRRSTIPLKFSSVPIGSVITKGLAAKTLFICLTTLRKSAPTLSSLLTKIILATAESFAYRQLVSD